VDVAVVGSGFAGVFLGLRLLEAGLSVAIVEAGGAVDPAHPDGRSDLLPVRNAGRVAYPIEASRTIGLGGTSAKWSGVVTRLLPADFAVRSRFGYAADWPLAYADLEPWYCEAEAALCAATRVPSLPVGARSCPFPVERPGYEPPRLAFESTPLAFGPLPRSERPGTREPVRLAGTELARFAAAPGATLLAEHQALRLSSDAQGRVNGLEVRAPDGRLLTLRARTYVVAAGVLESARLLLISRAPAWPDGLGNASGWVGRGFNCHPSDRARWAVAEGGASLPAGIHRTTSLEERFRERGLGACHFQIHAASGTLSIHVHPELEARRENRLVLAAEGEDEAALLHFDHSERDLRTLAEGRRVREALARELGLDPARAERSTTDRGHPAGTCRMATGAAEGVVDRDLRVFGTENLYVSGASVFPAAGTANPTLTVVALTLRLADSLARRLS
jgi:choline dehydrogenase-like flavoprotein